MSNNEAFIRSLDRVLAMDRAGLLQARSAYGESWCKRGGVGAYMMMARKIDRLEQYLTVQMKDMGKEWDVLEACRIDGRPEGCIDTIRDLRRYLVLIEAKLIEEGCEHSALPKDMASTAEDDTPPASVLHPA